MSAGRDTIEGRLPFLLELADELGVPHRVVPWVTRGGGGEVVSATVRLQIDRGAHDPQEDGGRHGWVDATNEHDVRAAAERRSRAPVDVDPVGTSKSPPARPEPGVYRGRRVLPAAEILLQVDLNEPAMKGAVQVREVEDRRTEDPRDTLFVDELSVDWTRVLDPTQRAKGAVFLALVARSLLEGEPVDLRPAISLSGQHATRLAEAMALAARRTLGGR